MSNFELADDFNSSSTTRNADIPLALRTPTKFLSVGVLVLYCLTIVVIWMSIFPLLQIMIPTQITMLDARHKIADYSLISAMGALTALITFPLVGALSDRTTLRLGRRRPWIIGGTIGAALVLVFLGGVPNILWLGTGWVLFTIFANITQAGLFTIIADQVPARQRALVSAFVGLSIPVGIALGSVLVGRILKTPQLSYYVIAGLLLIFGLLFSLIMHDEPLPKGALPPFNFVSFIAGFWINPVKHPDFGWAWLTRFLLILGYACGTSYLFFFLQDAVHYPQPAQGVSTFQLISTGLLLVASIGSGILSDRSQRRKIFVMGAGCTMGIALLILAFFPSWPMVQFAAAVLGLGYGIYVAVDLALVIQVLPSAQNRGKDMGVINIAATIPQVLAPALIGIMISTFHSYLLLFTLAAILLFLASALIPRIKEVR